MSYTGDFNCSKLFPRIKRCKEKTEFQVLNKRPWTNGTVFNRGINIDNKQNIITIVQHQ